MHERVRNPRSDDKVFNLGFRRPADSLAFTLPAIHGRPDEMLDIRGFGCFYDVLAVQLLAFVPVFVELGEAEDAPGILERRGCLFQRAQIGLDDFDPFRSKGLRFLGRCVAGYSTDCVFACRLFEQPVDDGAALPAVRSNIIVGQIGSRGTDRECTYCPVAPVTTMSLDGEDMVGR